MNQIPQFLTGYNMYMNLYNAPVKLVGVNGDITLPKFESIGDTVSGAGILGEFETPVPGAFKSQQLEIGFRVTDKAMFQAASMGNIASFTFRGSQHITNFGTSKATEQPVRIESRGGIKSIDLGKASPGKATDSKIVQEILAISIYIDNKEALHLDKLNYIYRLYGVDMTSGASKNM